MDYSRFVILSILGVSLAFGALQALSSNKPKPLFYLIHWTIHLSLLTLSILQLRRQEMMAGQAIFTESQSVNEKVEQDAQRFELNSLR